jgi:hypothetical protein
VLQRAQVASKDASLDRLLRKTCSSRFPAVVNRTGGYA